MLAFSNDWTASSRVILAMQHRLERVCMNYGYTSGKVGASILVLIGKPLSSFLQAPTRIRRHELLLKQRRIGKSMKNGKKPLTEPYDELRKRHLRNPEVAAEYLTLAFQEGNPDEIRDSIRRVMEANNDVMPKSVERSLAEMSSRMGRHGLTLTIQPAKRIHRTLKPPRKSAIRS